MLVRMPKKTLIHNILLGLVLSVGLFPVLFFGVVEMGIAEASSDTDSQQVGDKALFDRYVENIAFGAGEKLTFDIKYGFITAGGATIEVARLVEYENRPCYQIVTRAYSNSFFSSFFKVEDRVESIMDATGLYSWRFEKNLREGNYSSDRMYTFDQRNHLVVYKGDTVATEPYMQDALSAMFFVRTQPLEPGKSIYVDNFVDGRKSRLEVKVIERETITVDAGTFQCIVVEPVTKSAGVFKHDGRLKVWLTDDRLRLPVLMKSKVFVGSIAAELVDYELGNLDEL